MVRLRGASRLLLILVIATIVQAGTTSGALALFTRTFSNPANTFATDILEPPTGLTAAPGTGTPKIKLNWTATVDCYASGYRVFRSTSGGGPYTQIKQLTPATTTQYADTTVTTGTTYYYVLRSFYQNWQSINSNEASATP